MAKTSLIVEISQNKRHVKRTVLQRWLRDTAQQIYSHLGKVAGMQHHYVNDESSLSVAMQLTGKQLMLMG